MHIICPHCTTSYAIDLATLGASGRTVRCSRCKEVWLARPEDATEIGASMSAMAEAGGQTSAAGAAAEWEALAREDDGQEQGIPVVDSPSISGDWPASAGGQRPPQSSETHGPSIAHGGPDAEPARPQRLSLLQRLVNPPALLRASGKPFVSLPTVCAAMGALVLALMIWRVDVVRLLPQTATFYKMVGLDVNLP